MRGLQQFGPVMCLFVFTLANVAAQERGIPMRGHVYLPRTHGATELSTYIDAEARRIVALGDFVESVAVARRIHVDADREAIKNSVLFVQAYFDRKRINQQYRREQNPTYLDDEQRRDQVMQRRIVDMPQTGLEGDVTDELNWLLNRLATGEQSYQFIFFGRGSGLAEAGQVRFQ